MEETKNNQEALRLLEEASLVSSLIKDKERKSGVIKEDHMYPVTREETLKMADLLKQAEAAADNPDDPQFREKAVQIQAIVDFSLSKHRTWSWGIILGAALFAALLFLGNKSGREEVKETKQKLSVIKDWTPADTVITWEACEANESYDAEAYKNPVSWKKSRLGDLKKYYEGRIASAEGSRAKADTASTKEKRKDYLKYAEKYQKEADEFRQEFDELAGSDFKGTRKLAVERYKKALRSDRAGANFFLFNMILILLLAAIYIWTGNPYGYELTRTQTRDKVLSWIRKVCFTIAGFCFGGAILSNLFADDLLVKYTYASGRTETRSEADIAGTVMNIMKKITLLFIGVVVFIGISTLVMLIEGLGGLPEKIREIKAGA